MNWGQRRRNRPRWKWSFHESACRTSIKVYVSVWLAMQKKWSKAKQMRVLGSELDY